jgi:hypothetical protein
VVVTVSSLSKKAMQPEQRIVTRLPLTELWDSSGVLLLKRGRALGRNQMAELLRNNRVRFVTADCGLPLKWIPLDDRFRFWREEVKPHLIEPAIAKKGFRLENCPGEYCYVGSEWVADDQEAVILLESYH